MPTFYFTILHPFSFPYPFFPSGFRVFDLLVGEPFDFTTEKRGVNPVQVHTVLEWVLSGISWDRGGSSRRRPPDSRCYGEGRVFEVEEDPGLKDGLVCLWGHSTVVPLPNVDLRKKRASVKRRRNLLLRCDWRVTATKVRLTTLSWTFRPFTYG